MQNPNHQSNPNHNSVRLWSQLMTGASLIKEKQGKCRPQWLNCRRLQTNGCTEFWVHMGFYELLDWTSCRSTSTTDLNANQSGMSSPARKSCLNLVPDSFS